MFGLNFKLAATSQVELSTRMNQLLPLFHLPVSESTCSVSIRLGCHYVVGFQDNFKLNFKLMMSPGSSESRACGRRGRRLLSLATIGPGSGPEPDLDLGQSDSQALTRLAPRP
jgi:hypothetical protein